MGRTLADDLIQADEGAPANEKNIGRIDTDIILLGMFSPAFRRHVACRPFHEFQQRLLHAFSGHVARDRGALGFRLILSISSM